MRKPNLAEVALFMSIGLGLHSLTAFADGGKQSWSLNVGYHNPPDSTVGVNFLKFWQNFALEFGIGALDLNSPSRTERSKGSSDGTTTLSAAGDVNLKYLFGTGEIRPYVQGGVGTAGALSVGKNSGADASTGRLFGGAGLFLLGNTIYGYGSYNIEGDDRFFQAGIGFYF